MIVDEKQLISVKYDVLAYKSTDIKNLKTTRVSKMFKNAFKCLQALKTLKKRRDDEQDHAEKIKLDKQVQNFKPNHILFRVKYNYDSDTKKRQRGNKLSAEEKQYAEFWYKLLTE